MKPKHSGHTLVFSLCLLMLLPTIALAGNSIRWYKYGEGMALAEKKKTPLLLHFRADWCFYCRIMARKTFQDPLVVSYLNRNFIAVIVDVDKEVETAFRYGVRAIPDTWFLTQQGKKTRNFRGYIGPEDLLSILKEVQRIASEGE